MCVFQMNSFMKCLYILTLVVLVTVDMSIGRSFQMEKLPEYKSSYSPTKEHAYYNYNNNQKSEEDFQEKIRDYMTLIEELSPLFKEVEKTVNSRTNKQQYEELENTVKYQPPEEDNRAPWPKKWVNFERKKVYHESDDELEDSLLNSQFEIGYPTIHEKTTRSANIPAIHRIPKRLVKYEIHADDIPRIPIPEHRLAEKRATAEYGGKNEFEDYLKSIKDELKFAAPVKKSQGSLLHFISGKGFIGPVVARKPSDSRWGRNGNISQVRTYSSFNSDMGR